MFTLARLDTLRDGGVEGESLCANGCKGIFSFVMLHWLMSMSINLITGSVDK
jgi:hypothetical protein